MKLRALLIAGWIGLCLLLATPKVAPLPPALPAVAAVQSIQPVATWTPPTLTLLWDGCSITNVVDTVNECDSIPFNWHPIFSMPCVVGQMSYQITADKPMGFFQIERSATQ